MPTHEYEVLRHSRLAAELSDPECEVLAALIETRRLAGDAIVCAQGESDSRLHLVVSGALAVSRKDEEGRWENLHVKTAGDLVGELSFLDGTPHHSTLRALGPTEIASLERERLESLVTKHPWIVYRVMRAIVHETHELQRRMSLQVAELGNYIFKQHGRY